MISVLHDPETTISQNTINVQINNPIIQNLPNRSSTTQNEIDNLFGINLFQYQRNNFFLMDELILLGTYSPILKSKEKSNPLDFSRRSEFYLDIEHAPDKTRFHFEPITHGPNTLSEYDEKINNTIAGVSDLWTLTPIISQNQFLIPNREKYSLHKITPKPSLDDVLLNMSQKFDISYIPKLKSFVSMPIILEIPNLPERLDKIIDHISSFIHKLGRTGKSNIDVFHDEEIENFQSITIEYVIKNVTSDQCIEWTESLVSEILTIDENMLDIIRVEIIPDDI